MKSDLLNFYHIFANPHTRELLSLDCNVFKAAYESFELDYHVSLKDVQFLATKVGVEQSSVRSSIARFARLSESINSPFLKSMPFLEEDIKGSLELGPKRIYFFGE